MERDYDVVIAGGGPAGLNAALVLGRARRRVLLCDGGPGRNALAAEAHGVFTRDGTPPADLRRIGREQLAPYGVEIRPTEVEDARHDGSRNRFLATLRDGSTVTTRKLLLATGLVDDLPEIEGLADHWGRSVVDCPFCHGWEVRDEPLAVYGRGEISVQFAIFVRNWSRDVVLCTDGPAGLTDDQRRRLAALEVTVREERIDRLDGTDGALERIVFADGESLPRRALFLRPAQRQRADLPSRLGCEITETGKIRVDEVGRTSVPGVSAAGDAANLVPLVITAAASGAAAAVGLVRDLVAEDAARIAPSE